MSNSTIIQDLTKELPRDPKLAILQFARTVRAYCRKISPNKLEQKDAVAIFLFYAKFIRRFDIYVDFSIDTDRVQSVAQDAVTEVTDRIISNEAKILEASISSEVDDVISVFSASVDDDGFGVARLNSQEKQKIHDHLSNIRNLIEESEISQKKKNALFDRLNSLVSEVDAYGTRTDRFFAFLGDIAFVAGDMTKKAKPLFDEVKDMMKIVSRSRARQEGVSLPPGDETVLLPPPTGSNIGD
ncbi:hypothetical protein IY145_22215 [Methylosinus sp. H3A]|uniref:hypothetical protein n=1 Tax=Methylosinus sp. H3A TaxID=2785786 RepID=UPI0018C27BDF|nr:hypothetical protein [Methylosinus sp. H3A]MBG0812060.1 hypothetical protein [Methylosinus sp. H3A]